ncbi:MAG: universal stress protein [Planctomycetes bacterium]|nr:universal stress protein [Planctomycetota bacterium]
MLERILVPLDGSPAGARILEVIRPLARRAHGKVVLFHAAEPPLAAGMNSGFVGQDIRLDAEKYLEGLVREIQPQGFHMEILVRVGPAAGVILDGIKETKATMVAMATHGRTGLARLAFGSVAEQVLHASDVPVLMLRSVEGTPPHGGSDKNVFAQVLVPVDGSDLALGVAPRVAVIAKACGSRVILIHVLPPEPARSESLEHADAIFAAAKKSFGAAGVKVEDTMIRTGDAASEILDACRQRPIAAIAMSSHGRSGLARLVMGSVAESVVRGSWLPVLVARSFRK